MINDGLFDKYPCDAIFSMHNMPGWPQGALDLREGPMMASSDKVYITLVGHGGHGASAAQGSRSGGGGSQPGDGVADRRLRATSIHYKQRW